MKKYALLLLPLVAVSLASCDSKINPEVANAFKGEYWMKTVVYTMYEGAVTEERGPVWSPVSIYEEDGRLFVRTDWFGAPDIDTTSGAYHEYVLDYPDHPNYINARYNEEEPENPESGGIDVVPANNITVVYLVNGVLRTMRNGAILRSLPIKVKSGSEKVLNLYDFKPFRISLTDASGVKLAEVDVAYKYGPIVKNGETITWDVTMPFDFLKSYSSHEKIDEVVHKNVLYRK